MTNESPILRDSFGRQHTYLRISLTERCNLRCTYCMPAEGVTLSPTQQLMTADEIFEIASLFVKHGVTKIRLTGGEPLVRKDAALIMEKLATLPVELGITTNGVMVNSFIPVFEQCGIRTINLSLDSLNPERNRQMTRRDYFQKAYDHMFLLLENGFKVKVNCVLMKGSNDDEIVDFVALGKQHPLHIRFIEFMPFDGNRWNLDKLVSMKDILDNVSHGFGKENLVKLEDAPHDTARKYQIKGFRGDFAIISSVTNPFCDGCNRIRLTANGKLRNCLFSTSETDLLSLFREGKSLEPVIQQHLLTKKKVRNGMESLGDFSNPDHHKGNRSMITLGG